MLLFSPLADDEYAKHADGTGKAKYSSYATPVGIVDI
tara:strand:- start:226 stop:336 length:111 start_codon:yes stop_codon:yes gene_type:complete